MFGLWEGGLAQLYQGKVCTSIIVTGNRVMYSLSYCNHFVGQVSVGLVVVFLSCEWCCFDGLEPAWSAMHMCGELDMAELEIHAVIFDFVQGLTAGECSQRAIFTPTPLRNVQHLERCDVVG